MKISKTLMILVSILTLVWIAPAFAAEPGAIELKATATKMIVLTNDEGVERTEFVTPDRVVPGDKIAYTIAATNVSTSSVEQVVITDPIPEQMLFVRGTEESEGARVVFSVDGGASFDLEDRLVVKGQDGLERPATSADFTHIRWTFESPLAPAAERAVRFVALVE